ncbi:homocysteine-responsive endoplasmic reticulum-resident ubiquitin-like domain member 2 protein [Rhagoletis pomonella]|uniref:homocysteine-responsive endoplasmic reticulum-resident ubiquitin-like domain member 2 protein n=1 Tax=Rhagoletis pomonella TaxID=28610 RepID=UPI0017811916|nr:homocysteine-responsive endoplasmic reticulum-resident ubiquitin-like domain member 2 protein [Rhagoletis pomonella]XP_036342946.1 homocysteine-responsive endoplasmic reticulum-resident ubiquitin-like domain member 2 protein [Rhagoletis pomonella]
MNETAAATSSSSTSSAAAVADSASAAATTKTANAVGASVAGAGNAAAATTSTTTAAKSTSVKLLIKASNQQYDDQVLEIDLLWTVKRLKAHLALVYPNKPPVDEQKLIYSGQLLNDDLLLKDVIRSYKDVYTHNHIIHLVYTPKNSFNTNFAQKTKGSTSNMSPNTNNTNADGLRQRHIAGGGMSSNATAQQNIQQQYYQQYQAQHPNFVYPQHNQQMLNPLCPVYDPNNPQYALPFGFPGLLNMQAMATQQAAIYNWMQQVYSQYMEQCMRMSNTTATVTGIPNLFATNAAASAAANMPIAGAANPFGFNPFLQQMPFLAPTTAAAGVATAGATHPVIPAATLLSQQARPANLVGAQPVHGTDGNAAAMQAAGGEQAQAQPERQHAAAPRFPNIVQDEQENRDWLDNFFSITRLAIFLTILYFNSSPLRCIGVVVIAGVIYLYHIGVLRLRNERNNNNINRNNNAADADQIRRGVRQVQQAAQANEQRNPENAAAAADDAVDVQQQTNANSAGAEGAAAVAADATENNDNTASVISVMRTFVVTFFTSLLPETPTL